ncbi:MAG: bacterial Ig-like domain-containing protein, partial [Lachnospiraceae bacterium]|nr:bacterial Ig-like domain-containing protein [Lachnospiraceae bacterium]
MKKGMRRWKLLSVLLMTAMIGSLLTGVPHRMDSKVQAAQTLKNPRKSTNGVVTWDCVYFGRYPQSDATGNTTDAIKWRVLSVTGQDAFLVADCNLDVYHYYDSFSDITWEKGLVRSWLNGYGYSSNSRSVDFRKKGFIDKAFTDTEKGAIYTTKVVTGNNPGALNSVGGNDTNDKLFLLSYEEVTNSSYGFASTVSEDDAKIRKNTAYVGAGGIEKSNYTNGAGKSGCWWLRSPGSFNKNAMYIGEAGYTYIEGMGVDVGYIAICPALHLNLSNSDLWSYAGTVSSDGSSTAGEEPPTEQQRNGSTAVITSIQATKTKTVYKTTDTWSTKDITVTATYSDGHTEMVADGTWTCSSLDIKEAGNKQLDITYGGVQTSLTIKVYEPVRITTQPISQNVTAGGQASFSVKVSGTAPYTYQWMMSPDGRVWTKIPNAGNASYTTDKLQVSDDETHYKCVVTNGEGTAKTEVTSDEAEVRVGKLQVQHIGKNMTVRYDCSDIDVSQCFNLDSRVSGALYNLIEGGGILDGTQLIVSRPGTFRLKVQTYEQGNYAAASAEAELTVLPALVTNVGKDAVLPYTSGKKIDVREYFTLDSNAGVASYFVQGPDGNTEEVNRYMLTIQQPGIYTLQVHTYPDDELYEEGTATAILTVGENLISATIAGYSGVYDGMQHGLQIDKDEDTTIQYSEDGEDYVDEQPVYMDAGTYTVFYKLSQDGKEDVFGSRTIAIEKRPVTIKAKNQSILLGDEPILTGQYTQSGLADGDVIRSIRLTPDPLSLTESGSICPSDAVIYNEASEDVTDNYSITYQNGRLTITEDPDSVVGIPVQHEGIDTTVEYSGKTIDVRNAFQLDENAGTASYVLTSEGTGTGSLLGNTLRIRSAGTFFVKLRTAANESYAEGEATAVITVTKGKGTGTVVIEDVVYGERPAPRAESRTNGTDAVTWLYRRVGETEYRPDIPTEKGRYQVKAIFAETDLYQECKAEAFFEIMESENDPDEADQPVPDSTEDTG